MTLYVSLLYQLMLTKLESKGIQGKYTQLLEQQVQMIPRLAPTPPPLVRPRVNPVCDKAILILLQIF